MPSDSLEPGDSHGSHQEPEPATSHDLSPYNPALAIAAERREKEMSFKESRKADKRLILYALGFSGTIIMEGYGLALITYLFTFTVFRERYGMYVEDTQAWEVGPSLPG